MVPQGLQAILALLLLLPGFVSARLVRLMSARNQQSELERVIEALIHSFFIYVVYLLIFGPRLPVTWTVQPALPAQFITNVYRLRIATLVIISVCMGLGWGYVKGHDLLAKVLRKLKLTERTSRESVWNDVFVSLGSGTVQVELADGRSVVGWLNRYSDTGDESALFLEKASWVSENGEYIPIEGAGVLLTDKAEIKFVMFLRAASMADESGKEMPAVSAQR